MLFTFFILLGLSYLRVFLQKLVNLYSFLEIRDRFYTHTEKCQNCFPYIDSARIHSTHHLKEVCVEIKSIKVFWNLLYVKNLPLFHVDLPCSLCYCVSKNSINSCCKQQFLANTDYIKNRGFSDIGQKCIFIECAAIIQKCTQPGQSI